MPKFAANLSTMFREYAMPERYAAAAKAGFRAVEVQQPYDHQIEDIKAWLDVNALQMVLINTRHMNPLGLATTPGMESDFQGIMREAISWAASLGIEMIHTLAGPRLPDSDKVFLANIEWACDAAAAEGIDVLLEPFNNRDAPNYLYHTSAAAINLMDQLQCPNLKLQYDFYHMQIMEGDLLANIERHLPRIGHIQFSSVPGRHEPQFGEVNIPFLLDRLDAIGYRGWVGCEYFAKEDTLSGLDGWAARYGLGS